MADKPKIKIRDTRKYDTVSGKKLTDKNRMHADIYTEQLKDIIKHSKLNDIDPYTALAIGLQETNLGIKDPNNMFQIAQNSEYYNEMWDNPFGAATKYMKEKFDYGKRLGKKTEEDIIQAWNGYGSLKDKGVMYGIDTNKTPIHTKQNPVYGKRIVNLRDSVIKTNPDIVKLVDKYEKGGKMKKIDKNRYRVVDLYDGEMYGIGGWLDDALSGGLSGAAMGSTILPGIGTAIGGVLGAITGGIGGSKQAKAEEEERKRQLALNKTIMPSTVGLENTTGTVMPFKNGGKVEKVIGEFKRGKLHSGSKKGPIVKNRKQAIAIALSEAGMSKYANGGDMMNQDLIEIEGPSHEEGGVQFTPDAELEGGETVYNDVVNSDSIKITKELAEQYGLPKQAINKTVAEYSKIINNKYKDRDVDPFAMKSKEMELNNVSQMSMEVAEMMKGKESGKYKYGDDEPLTGWRKRVHDRSKLMEGKPRQSLWEEITDPLSLAFGKGYQENYNNPIQIPEVTISANKNTTPIIPINNNSINTMKSGIKGTQGQTRQTPIQYEYQQSPGYQLQDAWIDYAKRNNQIGKVNIPNITNTPLVSSNMNKVRPFSGTKPITKNKKPLFGDKGENTGEGLNKLLGAAPIIMGGVNALRSMIEGPEDPVKLGRVHYDPMHPEFIDPAYQLRQNADAFATGNEQMQQQSKKDWLRRRIQSSTEEGKNASNILGQVQAANTQMLNQTNQANQQNRMQTNQLNLELGLQEENINAANKGAWETNRDYQLNNLATMSGEYARDQRLEGADQRYKDRILEMMGKYGESMGIGVDDNGIPYRIGNAGSPMLTNNLSNINFNQPAFNEQNYRDPVELERGAYYQQLRNPLNGRNWLTSGRKWDRSGGSFR